MWVDDLQPLDIFKIGDITGNQHQIIHKSRSSNDGIWQFGFIFLAYFNAYIYNIACQIKYSSISIKLVSSW